MGSAHNRRQRYADYQKRVHFHPKVRKLPFAPMRGIPLQTERSGSGFLHGDPTEDSQNTAIAGVAGFVVARSHDPGKLSRVYPASPVFSRSLRILMPTSPRSVSLHAACAPWLQKVGLVAGLALTFTLSACGGATRPFTEEEEAGVGGGCEDGATKTADDGCNTCTCADGVWACTEKACVSTCEDGETKMADDGCNVCTCMDGTWACTEEGCGQPECRDGATKTADDGCNTCTCSDGSWACTEKACPTPACEDGETDGCACTCVDGQWACTDRYCPEPECEEGAITDDGCNTCQCVNGGWLCTQRACPEPEPVCEEGAMMNNGCNDCVCSGGMWACDARACPEPECEIGEVTDDGCNSCECTADGWVCTDRACPEPECNDGETRFDGCATCTCQGGVFLCPAIACEQCQEGQMQQVDCNTCTCTDGNWACTEKACTPCGGELGETCAEAEYCAYEEGQTCGWADATAVCLPRPEACDEIYAPVCGCDGSTYGNACLAAAAGTGVLQSGECPMQ